MIPATLAAAWEAARAADALVQRYRDFFACLDWSVVPERDPSRPWPGSPPHPRTAYGKALLVKLVEGKRYITELRAFLLEHPLLVLELGFRPVLDPTQPLGFDVERTVPGERWLRHQQQTFDPAVLGALLAGTVHTLQAESPELGTTVAVDVQHLYAWVGANNPKVGGSHRFDPARQPRGDPDCRLGVKEHRNQGTRRTKEHLWGYGTSIVSTTDPLAGDVVLANYTQPFNRQDITHFHPVHAQAVAHLGHHPTNLAADAAFDAWHVYQSYAERGGIAAIPRNRRGPAPERDAAGHLICQRGLVMVPTRQFPHEDGYLAQRYRCPLRVPTPTGESCDHRQFPKGGCTKSINLEAGGRMRIELDRQGAAYQTIYPQRTSAERINSQAAALGITHPKVRNARSVHTLNTLTYIVINVRALLRIQDHHASRPPPHALC